MPFWWLGCVAEPPLEGLVLRQVLCRRRWAGVEDRWAEATVGECKRWWDGRGRLDVDDVEGHPTPDGVGGDLLFLKAEGCFLRGFVEDVGTALCLRFRSPWADRGVVTDAVENLSAKGTLCVLGEERDAEVMLHGCSIEIHVPVKK